MKTDKDELKLVLKGVLIFIAVIILFCGYSLIKFNTSSGDDYGGRTMVCVMAQDFVQKSLKAPSTAKFPSCSYDTQIINMENNTFKIKSYVDSQNSFGAMIRTNYVAELKYLDNKKWRLLDLEFDE